MTEGALKPFNLQTIKLSDYQTIKLLDYQTTKLLDYQTTKLSNYQTTKLSDYLCLDPGGKSCQFLSQRIDDPLIAAFIPQLLKLVLFQGQFPAGLVKTGGPESAQEQCDAGCHR